MSNDTITAGDLRDRQLIAAAGCEMIIDRIIHGDGEMRSEQVRTRDVATVLEMVRHGIGTTLLSEISLPGPICMDCGRAASIRRRFAPSILFFGPTVRSGIWSNGSATWRRTPEAERHKKL